jgi:hypothetical protein
MTMIRLVKGQRNSGIVLYYGVAYHSDINLIDGDYILYFY